MDALNFAGIVKCSWAKPKIRKQGVSFGPSSHSKSANKMMESSEGNHLHQSAQAWKGENENQII